MDSMNGLFFIALGILFLISNIPIPTLVIFSPTGWKIKVPIGIALIVLGVIIEGWLPLPSFW